MTAKSMRIERTEASQMRLYAVLFTVLPILAAVGLLWLGGLLPKIGAVLCAAIAVQSIRANLRFIHRLELIGDRVVAHPLWSKTPVTHSDLTEVRVELALDREGTPVASYYTLVFPSGPVVVQPSAFPEAAKFVTSLVKASYPTPSFPLQLGEGTLQHWGRFPNQPTLGVTAGYRFADQTLMSFFVYGKVEGDLNEELERAISDIGKITSKKRTVTTVKDRGEKSIAGLRFKTASVEIEIGSRRSESELLLASRKKSYLKLRITAAPGQPIPKDKIEATISGFLKANGGA